MIDAATTRWHRIAPGQYELLCAEGRRIAIVERSAIMPWCWWYETFQAVVYTAGNQISLVRAKAAVMKAFEKSETAEEAQGATP